ncbi:hypothetical protein GS495_12575 [Rhodococcus hoagii]|nr:hypothetical protein [Prescottella equi]
MALTSSGQVVAWGADTYGATEVPAPPEGQTYTAIAAGTHHSLALTSAGQVIGWGMGTDGQTMTPAGHTYTAIAANSFHSAGLTTTGDIIGWGDNYYGQVTAPESNNQSCSAIATGVYHSLAVCAEAPSTSSLSSLTFGS